MNRREYQGLLKIAKEQVPMGVYALEKRITQNFDVITAAVSQTERINQTVQNPGI